MPPPPEAWLLPQRRPTPGQLVPARLEGAIAMTVLLPSSLDEALAMLSREVPEDGGAAREDADHPIPMAGGTDLLVHWPQRAPEHKRTYVDLWGVAELKPHRWTDDALVLGGLTTYWDVIRDPRAREELPLLAAAARQVGAVQIQSRGTWAGNIVNGSPAADGVPVLMAYDATVVLRSARGEREEVALAEFYSGYKEMRLHPDQLVTEIRLPRRAHGYQVFEKVGSRKAQAIAKVGLAIARSEEGWRVVAASMAPTVRRCRAVERLLEEETPASGPEDLLPAIREDVTPIDDIRSTARYRETVMARVLYHDLRGVAPAFT